MDKIIYLDNNATTQLDSRILETILPFFTKNYANAASNHEFGRSVYNAINISRKKVAELIGAESNEIIFTSGSTEAINLAIKGVADSYSSKGQHIITAQSEHPAVLDTCNFLERKGFEVSYVPVKSDGLLDVNSIKDIIRKDTILVSVMYVNNEIGVIQPIKELAIIAHEYGSIFMTDATQAVGKIPIDVNDIGIDLMPFSGHKFYGPKGIGALYIRSKGENQVKLTPLLHGGGHEGSFRSGTLNVPGIIGLSKACELAKNEMNENSRKIKFLRDLLEENLLKIKNSFINGSKVNRLYNISNICFRGVDADTIMMGLKNIIVSNGSACTSTSIKPSHVLKALGKTDNEAYSSIRFSLGKFNVKEDIQIAIERLGELINQLRHMDN
jgi:cysteine desulfurase